MCFANSLATRLSFVWYFRTARARSVVRRAAEVKINVWGVPGVTGDLISANLETVVPVLARESQDRIGGRYEQDSRYAGRFRSVLGEVNDVVSKNADSTKKSKFSSKSHCVCVCEF